MPYLRSALGASLGRFSVRPSADTTGVSRGRHILEKHVGKRPQRFGGLTIKDLHDLHAVIGAYLKQVGTEGE